MLLVIAENKETDLHLEKIQVGTLALAVGVGVSVCGWRSYRVRYLFLAPTSLAPAFQTSFKI